MEVNEKLVNAAERRVHEVVRAAGEQRAQAERELADAGRTVDELEAKLIEANAEADALQQHRAQAERELADAARRVNELEAELYEANARADALQRRIAEGIALNRAQTGELATVREELTRIAQSAKATGEQHAAERVRLHAAIADIAAERDQARALLQAAQEEAREPMRRIQEQEAVLDALRAKVEESERDRARLGAMLGKARQETAEAERGAAAAEQVATDLRLEVAAERAAHVADLRSIIERLPSEVKNRL
jgi:chromosome segregation ATPase